MSNYTPYYEGGWKNEEEMTTTPICAEALNHMEDGIQDAHELADGLIAVPTSVRQALYTLLSSAAYAETGLTDEIAIIQSWAQQITAISVSPSTASITGTGTSQLSATTTPAGGTVTWSSSDTSVATVSSTGLVTGVGNGSCTITASAGGKSATCAVTVTGNATLESISAVYTQSGTVYDTDSLDDLKDDLVVTGTYDDTSTATITGYTLSGTLTAGTSTVTVSYGGKTTTFNVTVSTYDTSPSIAENGKSWTTSGTTSAKTGASITNYYEITIDATALKTTSHYDATNDYMTTGGDIWKLKYLIPNTASISMGSGGKTIAEVERNGERKFNYFSVSFSETKEGIMSDSRYTSNVLNADNGLIKISFTIPTADIDDSYAYWDETSSGVMPLGVSAGDIIFAGRDTPYYGLHNINEAST